MTTASISLQDLRQRLYVKAKAEKPWRVWGLYVHVCKEATLRAAYAMAKKNNGAPGIDGVTFVAIEATGVEPFLAPTAGRAGHAYLPAIAEPACGDSQRWQAGPRLRDSGDTGPGGAGSAQASAGTHL